MENEAAPTGGRLASPEVIGGKSNRHSGEKGAPQAPFFHAFFRVAAGTLWGRGRKGRRRVGRRGRGAVGAFFSCLFFGGCGGRGLPRGRAVVTGFAAGAGRSVEGVRAGGGWSRGVRAPFFVVWGMEPSLLRAAVFFWGKALCGGSRAGRMCGGEEKKRKKRSAKLPNASYGGSFVSRRGRWNKRSICGSSHKYHKYRANISPPSQDRRDSSQRA